MNEAPPRAAIPAQEFRVQSGEGLAPVAERLEERGFVVSARRFRILARLLGVDRAIVVLPALIALAGFGVLAGAALAATVFLKISDGTLRYSLHRTASELLYLPMAPGLRSSVKGAIDIVGQAGAKALGSLLVLGLVLLPDSRSAIAIAVVLFASAWITSGTRGCSP